MQFCYHCRVHHPEAQMRRIPTKVGYRWRCIRSIQAAQKSSGEREAFGRMQTEINRDEARRQAQFAHLVRFTQSD